MDYPGPVTDTTAETTGLDRLTSGYSGRILLVVSLGSLVSHLGWLVIPPLLPTITDDLGITSTQAGFALTLLVGLSAVCRYPGGRLADQLSRKTMLAFCFVAWIAGFAVLAVSTTYPLLLLGMVLVGLGLGVHIPTSFAQLSDLFDRKQGQAFGVNNAAFNLGGVAASVLAVVVLAVGYWQLAFAPLVVALVALAGLLHVWSGEAYVVGRVDIELRETVSRLLLQSRARRIVIVAAMFSFAWHGSVSFLPTFLIEERGMTAGLAGTAYAALFLTGVLATPLSGAVGDSVGSLLTIVATISFATVGLGWLIVAPTDATLFAGVILFAVGLTGFWPVMTSYLMTVFPAESRGGDYGAVGVVYSGFGSLGPTYVGTASGYLNFSGAYVGLIGLLLLCLVIVIGLVLR